MKAIAQAIRQPFAGVLAVGDTTWRSGERLAIAYFIYTALLASLHNLSTARRLSAWAIPFVIWGLALIESRFSKPWSRVTRDWATLGLILIAYRQIDWFAGAQPLSSWQGTWAAWDHTLLVRFGLQAAIESLGWVIPSGLEVVYLCLYLIPPVCLGILYLRLRRAEVLRFLTTLMLGTLFAYALLPHFPSISPRVVFATADLPNYSGIWRSINVWLLDHCDIMTSVFPSGHVAVAFSSAFGLKRAIPGRPRVWGFAFVFAALVYTATVYCRYHYAVDGLASIAITTLAWTMTEVADVNG